MKGSWAEYKAGVERYCAQGGAVKEVDPAIEATVKRAAIYDVVVLCDMPGPVPTNERSRKHGARAMDVFKKDFYRTAFLSFI